MKMLQERAAARGVKLPGKVASDPKDLDTCLPIYMRSPVSSEISSGPGAQGQVAGSNPIIDILSSPTAKAVLAGIVAMVVKRVMQGSAQKWLGRIPISALSC